MVLGTASHVGKSLLTAALCRIFREAGHNVAPFKSQNMSLNSAATPEGLEIGRAQALQAEGAGIAPSVHMNPILIKPTGMRSSQVVVRGKVWRHLTAADYHKSRVAELLPVVQESYNTLAAQHELLVIEGAGSPAEINLRSTDIVNMRIAEMANAACLLVGDIDRGGVFASILGTLELLEPHERARIRGFVINKFRGDVELLWPGIRSIEERTGIPCAGVVPFLKNLTLEEEDSAGIAQTHAGPWTHTDASGVRALKVAVVALPWLSNFTDFDALANESSVELRFVKTPEALQPADVILLPGTKQTVDDLDWMLASGIAETVKRHAHQGGIVIGICGGMQILGESINDEAGMERQGLATALGLLPIRSTMLPEKITRMATGTVRPNAFLANALAAIPISGYEIHLGETEYLDAAEPFARIQREAASAPAEILDGCVNAHGNVMGTYLHGLFDHDSFRHRFLAAAREHCHLQPPAQLLDREQERTAQWRRLADETRSALDMERICEWLALPGVTAGVAP